MEYCTTLPQALEKQRLAGTLQPLEVEMNPTVDSMVDQFLPSLTFKLLLDAVGDIAFQELLRANYEYQSSIVECCMFQHVAVAGMAGYLPSGYEVLDSEHTFDYYAGCFQDDPSKPVSRSPLPGMSTLLGVSVPDALIIRKKSCQAVGYVEATMSEDTDYLYRKKPAVKYHRRQKGFDPKSRCVVVTANTMDVKRDHKLSELTAGPIDLPFSDEEFQDHILCPSRARLYRERKDPEQEMARIFAHVKLPFDQRDFDKRFKQIDQLQKVLKESRRKLVQVIDFHRVTDTFLQA